ncbi:hypothetical protein HK097_003710 [Rhizophlyctis rosea]|uniref:Uncharacterized protein n=1 Tax=Rhizophlyctis rosea TaxID=64517 RepID=A0AAD5SL66_9FUNG|nr:hypothetical protein HK097_003710 [Rhizophlyctis rosea]
MSYWSTERPQTSIPHPHHRRIARHSAPYDNIFEHVDRNEQREEPTSTSRADYTEKLSQSRHINSRYRGADAVGATRERGRYLGLEDLDVWVERVRERNAPTLPSTGPGGDDRARLMVSTNRHDFTIPGFDPDAADSRSRQTMATKAAGRPIPRNSTSLQYESEAMHRYLDSYVPSFQKKRKEGLQTFDDDVFADGGQGRDEGDRWMGRGGGQGISAGLTIRIAGK